MDNFSDIEDDQDGNNPGTGAAGCAVIAAMITVIAMCGFILWAFAPWGG